MRKTIISTGALALLAAIGALAAGQIAQSATRTNATVAVHRTALGAVLVSKSGHTLYLFGKDRNGKSACSGSCATYWPPLLSRAKPTAGPGVTASLLGTTRRANGTQQVTYNRHPLYTYVLDKRAGQTSGEGISAFGAKWYAVSAKGAMVVEARGTPTTTTPTTSTPYPPYP
jgi:predicted lipoprotein with Yx(FWY)xxD motif